MGLDREYGEAFNPVDEDEDSHAGSGYDVDVLLEAADRIIHSVDRDVYWDDLVAATGEEAEAAAYEEAIQEVVDDIDDRVVEIIDRTELEHTEKRQRIQELRNPGRVLETVDAEASPEAQEAIQRAREAYGDGDAG